MKYLYLTTALALIASPTLADITPEELWQSWQESYGQLGVDFSAGSQTREGAVLVLQDVTFAMDFGFFQIDQTLSQMQLEALDNGTVSVSYDSNITATATLNLPDTPMPDITVTGQIEGAQGLVTGTIEDYIFELGIGRMELLGSAVVSTESGVQTTSTIKAISTGLNGRIHYARSDAGVNMSYTFTLDNVNNTQDSASSLGGTELNFKQSQRTLAEGYSGDISIFFPHPNPESGSGSLIPEGFTMDARIDVEQMNITQKTASPYFNMEMEIDQQDGDMSILVDGQNIALSSNAQKNFVSVVLPQFGPQPYRVDFADAAFAISLPYRPSDTPQDASIAISLDGITASDSIWALADPENTLSRAPADFAIAADFNSTLLLDWTNIEAVKAGAGTAPLLLHKITLGKFLVAFENALLAGAGAVDFITETMAPEPNGGAITFTLTGIPALLEKLGGLPLVDPSVISQVNGMLGMFTSPGENGALTSEVEFGEGGQVSVNGQRMR